MPRRRSAAPLALTGNDVDIDFNPAVDRLRIVSDGEQNLRVNPNNGALVFTDGALTPAANVTGAAYTNNAPATATAPAAPTTTLFDVDTASDRLVRQDPPNDGTLVDVGPLGVDLSGDVGFDISTAGTTTGGLGANTAYLAGDDRLYSVDTATGAATLVGAVAGGNERHRRGRSGPAARGARLRPGRPRRPAAAHGPRRRQRLAERARHRLRAARRARASSASTAARPTATVYGAGTDDRIYTINLATGAATHVQATAFTPSTTGTTFGLDFNPVVPATPPDRLRLVSDTDENLRLNPDAQTGAGDPALAYDPADPVNAATNPQITAAAYNNPVAGAAVTALYDIDTGVDDLVRQGAVNPPARTAAC